MEALSHLGIPIWREARLPLEHAALLRDPVFRGRGVPAGDGAPVLLIPGFLAGDPSLTVLSRWLERIGYTPCRAGIRANVDCTARALERLEDQLEQLAEEHGRPVRIVGQSRGGSMARVLAVRRPDIVDSIVTLGAPLSNQLAVHPLVRAQVRAVALIGSLRVPGLFSYDCAEGACCAQAREDAAAAFPAGVGFTSVYSRSDGVVDWRSCLDPAASQVEVDSTHCGMAVNGGVFRVVAEALRPRPDRLL
jgi:pimeloyl-ACP methyl ester carboxylesterase